MNARLLFCWVATLCLLCITGSASAHEVRPAYLELTEVAPAEFQVTWKQPIVADRRLPIDPVLPQDCTLLQQSLPENTGDALIERWQVGCDLRSGTISISGLTRTLTDVFVRVTYDNGDTLSRLLSPDQPALDLAAQAMPLLSYLLMGFEHLLFGIDHILFVVGLVLFIPDRWMLLKTITAFTLAHSLTLTLSVLQIVQVPQQPVEAVIALSILFLARELLLPESRRSVIMKLRPWLMAFAFGLLHGFGFAGALAEIGLPPDQLAWALALFNVGIELGQLLVIAMLLLGGWLLRGMRAGAAPLWHQLYGIVMGVMAGFWTINRLVLIS